MLYAIVDIETTGSYAMGNGITEIAIVVHDGRQILHTYETLINPNRHIPLFIQSLTGISNEMVRNAPSFQEVAGHIYEILQDKVFVAHNVNFDYSFVSHHLQACGYSWTAKKLCTVRLSRKIVPGLYSYSLGKLCHQLGIEHTNHHRAGGDAMATARLFSLLVERDERSAILEMLRGRNKEQYLPPHLPVEQVETLPENPGVYYFYNAAGKVIYVGKAINIKKRVRSHFSNNKPGKQKQDFLKDIHRISFKETATELMAHILESTEIRRLWPVHNRSQRGYLPQFGLFMYEDQRGIKRLAIEKHKPIFRPIYTFNTITEGHQRLRELIREFELCPRLCNLATSHSCETAITTGDCSGNCAEPSEVYNKRVESAIGWLEKHLPTFAYIDKGLRADQQSCILVRKGNFFGMGYIADRNLVHNLEKLEQQLEPLQDNDFIRNLIYKHAASFPEKCVTPG
ncbi:MAG: DNA polymerase III subunit epsilon [Sphingobacteriales bacterium]|nr:MAG: DNA polymerase III subunit epsilon [Sphingobacteriales bacterium]